MPFNWYPHLSPSRLALFTIPLRKPSGMFRGDCTHSYIVTIKSFLPQTCDILTRFSAMQRLCSTRNLGAYPEFPPQTRSLHLHARDIRQQEMGTDYPVHPRS